MATEILTCLAVSFRIYLTLGFLAQGVLAVAAQGQVPGGAEVQGRVVTASWVPLPGAEISVIGDSLSVLSDSEGRFLLRGISPGERVIRVRRIGYGAQDLSVTLKAGERKDVTIALTPGAYELPAVEVTARLAKPIEYAWTTKYDEFFRRQRVGLGYYISREDIDKTPATQTAELLLKVPGFQVRLGAPGLTPNSIRTLRCHLLSVWVDGRELPRNFEPIRRGKKAMMGDPQTPEQQTGVLLESIHPLQIEMIEVYTTPARGQAEFVGQSCGAIMIWTR